MDIVSSLNSAFTQVQRSESLSFATQGDSSKVSYKDRESVSSATGLPGGRGGQGGHSHLHSDSSSNRLSSAIQNAVSYNRSEGTTLILRTQEGDTVKLKFLNSESANAQNQQFEKGGTTLTDLSMSGSSSSKYKAVVEGDLNAAELNAVRDVLIQAREMANTFFDGNVKEAFGMARNFNIESEQLANVSMKLNVSETYTYAQKPYEQKIVQAPVAEPTMPITPAVDSVPPAAPVSVTPNADLVATLTQANVSAAAPATNRPDTTHIRQVAPARPDPVETRVQTAPDPVETPAQVTTNQVGNLSGALSTITSFLSQLTESLNAFNQQSQGPAQAHGPSAAFSFSSGFQLQVVSSLIGQLETNSAGETSPAGELAAKTVDELAMKMDAFVDATI